MQLVAADRLDVLAEVVARGALDLGQPRDRGVAQRQPQRAAPRRRRARSARCVPSRARVTMPAACSACRCWEVFAVDCPLARASSSTRARRLGEQVEQLEPARAGERLAHQRDRLEQRVLRRLVDLIRCYSIDHLIACQADARPGGRVFFRQLLNDDTACASYLLGCKTHGAVRGRRPARRPRRRVRRARRGAGRRRSSPCSRRTCRPTTSPGCPSSSSAPARPPTCPRAPASSSSTTRSPTARSSSSATPRSQAIATPGHALAHHAYLVTDHTRGDEPWLVLTGDALLVGDAGRPDLHAHGEHTVEEMARTLYRSLTERLLDAARPPRCSTRRTTRARSAAAACRPTRSRRSASSAATTARCSSTPRTRSSRRCSSDIPPAPEQQAAIVAANRTGRAARRARVTARAGPARAARERSRSSRCSSRSTRSSARWSGSSARRCR